MAEKEVRSSVNYVELTGLVAVMALMWTAVLILQTPTRSLSPIAAAFVDAGGVTTDAGLEPSARPKGDHESEVEASTDEVEVKDLELGDGGMDQRSIRVMHPDLRVQARLHDWLEPREEAAVSTSGSLECVADTATRQLVSVRCVSLAFFDPKKGGGAPSPQYAGLTLRISTDGPKELTLTDVLRPGVGKKEVVEACRKVADPDLACAWPPTTFSLVHGDSLFVCHNSHCVDIEEEANLIRPELTGQALP